MQAKHGACPSATTVLTQAADTTECVILAGPSAVIPIVFLPGIMGTNLQSAGKRKSGAEKGEPVWRPPNMDGIGPALGAIGQLFSYWFRGPATRQRRLDPGNVTVDSRGPIDTEGTLDKETARKRGWGTVMRSAYQPVMCQMERTLNNIMESGELLRWWSEEGLRNPSDYGEETGTAALTKEDLQHAAQYRYDVWAGGYNWLQSNSDSGTDIIRYIDDVVLAHYRKTGEAAEKVILVTHSMGGLVGRAVACLHNYGKLLGVVHGVMPATGAPATYHHCRCGYDGIAQVILGSNAAEVTAVMANSPGALELVPTSDYNGGKPWLKLGGMGGHDAQWLPVKDPYEEIYKSREWYGLVPAHHEKYLNPAGGRPSTRGATQLEQFDSRIDNVKMFQERISEQFPASAYVHYGDDVGQRSWATVHWKGASIAKLSSLEVLKDDGEGNLSMAARGLGPFKLRFGGALEAGDGTVPTVSGSAPAGRSIAARFRQGSGGRGEFSRRNAKGREQGYEHQASYEDCRSQWATLYSVAKIAGSADWA
ncbi:hypothetical protein N800_06430 [Lysobacter daejeonensis GH1-9]|uniref:GPI inositol-deacylase PGAP1-like alpha/beta domain-containing protein n=2 Tax=Aerolutibacter TaxID=3382701 RepID=A0A0A0EZM4_9GAMM|nr:hypothetical protein N800_06430 [Lysobacter daejeonensis GH1-9]